MGWLLKMYRENPEQPNGFADGFADHEIPFLNGYFIGGLDPIFRHTQIVRWSHSKSWSTSQPFLGGRERLQ